MEQRNKYILMILVAVMMLMTATTSLKVSRIYDNQELNNIRAELTKNEIKELIRDNATLEAKNNKLEAEILQEKMEGILNARK